MATAIEPLKAPAKARIEVAKLAGCPREIDLLAAAAAPEHAFLRSAWFAAAGAETLIASVDGAPVAAFPTVPAGPPVLGARSVAGIYWPFRSPVVAASCRPGDLAEILGVAHRENLLGPIWRLGPVYRDDPAARMLIDSAPAAGWTLLSRSLGRSFVLDLERAREDGPWPRPSTVKRLSGYRRDLAELGKLSLDSVTGSDWNARIFDDLASVEERSWVAGTDRSGAKFIEPRHRAVWEAYIVDPVLAEMLSAVIVRVDGRAIAFSFDLMAGPTQYGIAGTYDQAFARYNVGKLANETNLLWSAERGAVRFDWGAGDSGYKSRIGFAAASEIVDCLFVRRPAMARVLRARWERNATQEGDDGRRLPIGPAEALVLASLATAAAVTAMAE